VNFPIAIFGGGPGEIVIILAILLLLFGSTKLPKLARSLGSSVTEFRKGLRGEDDEKKKLDGGEGDKSDEDSDGVKKSE
jgi:sec-independent protein translocase protein TatA